MKTVENFVKIVENFIKNSSSILQTLKKSWKEPKIS